MSSPNQARKTAYMREFRARRRQNRECADCGGRLSPDERSRCEMCRELKRAKVARGKRRREVRAQHLIHSRTHKARLIAEGRCTTCGQKNPRAPKRLCAPCGARQSERRKIKLYRSPTVATREARVRSEWGRRVRKQRYAANLCSKCGKERPIVVFVRGKPRVLKYGATCLARQRAYRAQHDAYVASKSTKANAVV